MDSVYSDVMYFPMRLIHVYCVTQNSHIDKEDHLYVNKYSLIMERNPVSTLGIL